MALHAAGHVAAPGQALVVVLLQQVLADCSAKALPIVTIVNVLVGAILAFVGAVQLVNPATRPPAWSCRSAAGRAPRACATG